MIAVLRLAVGVVLKVSVITTLCPPRAGASCDGLRQTYPWMDTVTVYTKRHRG